MFETELEPAWSPASARGSIARSANLLDNAAKWSPPGGAVEVRLRDGELTVRDHGPGIAPEDLPHVFDRFYRAAAARGRAGSGSGWRSCGRSPSGTAGPSRPRRPPGGGALLRLALPVSHPIPIDAEPLLIPPRLHTGHANPRPSSPRSLATSALTLAACGGDPSTNGDAAANRQNQMDDAALEYARCMRENGVDMPDPKPGQRGIRLSQPEGVSQSTMRKADQACRKYLEAVKPPEMSEEQQKEFREGALANARCMREHGINFPDPTFGANGEAQCPHPPRQRHRSGEREVQGRGEGVREHAAEAARRQ